MPDLAWAQGTAGGGAGGPGPLLNLLPIALMFVILYVLMIRPQQRRAREHDAMVKSLKRNDDIVTSGGIYGRIQTVNDTVITVEIAPNVRIKLDRDQVASVVRGRDKDKETT